MFIRTLKVSTLAVCLMGVSLSASAKDLTVVGWGGVIQDAFRDAYFTPYQEAGLGSIQEDTTNGGLAKISAMVATDSVTWDVVQFPKDELLLACDEGLLEDLTDLQDEIGDALLPEATEPECGIGTLGWSLILAYDKDKISAAPTGWSDFFDVEKFPGKRGLRKGARLTLEVALMADGVQPDEVYSLLGTEEGFQRALNKLDSISDHIVWWESGAQPLEWLASGEVVMTAAYSGRVPAAIEEGRNFGMVWDNQIFSMEYWGIIKGGNKEAGEEYIKFVSTDDRQTAFAEIAAYGVTNLAAMKNIDPKRADDLPTSEENMKTALVLGSDFWLTNSHELQTKFTNWIAQ